MNDETARKHLGRMVKASRLRKFGTVDAARVEAKISRGAWDHVEKGDPVKEFTLAAVERALEWPAGRCEEILDSGLDSLDHAVAEAALSDTAREQIQQIIDADRATQINERRRHA